MAERNHVVVLLHGIRTHAPWAEMVKRVLESSPQIRAIPIGYGFFDVLRFLIPGPWRRRAITKVTSELHTIIGASHGNKLSILAHSFGTYAISHALMDNPDIKVHRLCLCGSIVPRSFRWNRIAGQQVSEIVNDCGTEDIWPLMAAGFSSGYGASGTFGFRSGVVTDRFHKFGHSDFFSKSFAREYWLPFFADGVIHDPEEGQDRPRRAPPMWQNLITTAKYWLVLPCALALTALGTLQLIKPAPGLKTQNLDQVDVGYTREFFIEALGQPRVVSSGTFQCGPRRIAATYSRWNDDEITVQGIFVDGNAQLFTVHLTRSPVNSVFDRADVDLGYENLNMIGEQHQGWFKIDDGRYPGYAERYYFGAAGKYYDYFYGFEAGALFGTELSMEELWKQAEASSDEYTHSYINARIEVTPTSAAVSETPSACEEVATDWYQLAAYLVALPPEWAEARFLDADWSPNE